MDKSTGYPGCDAEPIHRPGSIQPFGSLLILAADTLCVLAHAGTQSVWGAGHVADGQDLDALFEGVRGQPASWVLKSAQQMAPQHLRLLCRHTQLLLDITVYRHGAYVLLEIEPEQRWDNEAWVRLQRDLQHGIRAVHAATTVSVLCDVAAATVQNLTDFDRCMVYRFDADWHGEVVAESQGAQARAHSYLGHHFPASDIPPQARRIFETNWLRIISDRDGEPLLLSRADDPQTHEPFDLSATLLRSPAPVHLEYLRNMGVGASLTLSLKHNGKLWGLLTCHHNVAKHVPLAVRLACEQIGRLVSANLVVKAQQQEQTLRGILSQTLGQLTHNAKNHDSVELALCKSAPNLVDIMPSAPTAAATRLRGWWTFLGKVPSLSQLSALVAWLGTVVGDRGIYVSRCLRTDYPAAAAFADVASGLIAVALPGNADNFLLWFRPEQLQTRTWAGSPEKVVSPPGADGNPGRIHPRKSFSAWQETVSGTCAPWLGAEIDAATELKKIIVETELARQLESETQLRADIEAQKNRFEMLAEASDVLMASMDIDDCLNQFARLLTRNFCDTCVIYLKDKSQNSARTVLRHRTPEGQAVLMGINNFAGLHEVAGSPVAQAFAGKPVLRERVTESYLQQFSSGEGYAEFIKHTLGAESLLAVPMCSRDAVVGVVKFLRSERVNRFHLDDQHLAVELARRAAHAVENVGLYCDANQAIATREHVLHVVSHDLKNPVTAIALSTDAIERKVAKAVKLGTGALVDLQGPLSRIRASGQRMLRLIDDLLNVSKMENGRFALHTEEVTTEALLEEINLLAEPLAQAKGVAVQLKNSYSGTVFPCDKDRMLQVFGNLVGNAVKFTPPGGTVTLEVTDVTGQEVTFAVSDTGPGIKQEDLPHVFDRYWQASRTAAQGTGLGLFIAQGIVQAHAGSLSVDSEPTGGATFWVRLPQRAHHLEVPEN